MSSAYTPQTAMFIFAHPDDIEFGVAGTAARWARAGCRVVYVVITDGTHDIDITFFKAWGHEKVLVPGARGIFAGVVGTYNNRLQLTHPGYTMLDDFDAGDRKDLIPIYRAVGSLHTWTVTESVRRVLDVLDEVPDPIPESVRTTRRRVSRTHALGGIHTPNSWEEVEQALLRHSSVADCLVAGRPSERWGEEVVALDAANAGVGDTVLINNDGGSAQMIMGDKKLMAAVTICGVVDQYTYRGKTTYVH